MYFKTGDGRSAGSLRGSHRPSPLRTRRTRRSAGCWRRRAKLPEAIESYRRAQSITPWCSMRARCTIFTGDRHRDEAQEQADMIDL